MNDQIKKLMLEAGYAAPEIAGRARKLSELIVEECNQYALRNWEHGRLLGQDLKIHFGFGDEE
jgi:hypothetical protein